MRRALSAAFAALLACTAPAAEGLATEVLRSPVNQVFQWSHSAENTGWPGTLKTRSSAYLWIPEGCRRVRGLVIMATNCPEHLLVGHPAIRKACTEHDLGIVWAVPSFWYFGKEAKDNEKVQVDFLQKLLDGLAQTSGYDEVATVPWLPVGESGHLLMVTGLVDQRPERCMAAITVKNPQYPKDRSVPMLWTLGTAQEWGQKKSDIRKSWLGQRGWTHDPKWPLASLIEPGTGHFYCTDPMAVYLSRFIAAATVRLPEDGGATLKPVPFEQGAYAFMPAPGAEDPAVTAYAATPVNERNKPWFFTADLARAAQDFARVDWTAKTQLPAVTAGENTTVEPFAFQDSIAKVTVTTNGEFSLGTTLLPEIPAGFVGAGEPLATTPGEPVVTWICGPVAPLGGNRFRIALDRTWKGAACYLAVIKEGAAGVRYALQPVAVNLAENTKGKAQAISFPPLGSVKAGTASVPLKATSDAGLPVQFYVESGPAVVQDGKLVLTAIPPRTRFPVSVTVAAWQWGSPAEPQVRMAPIVKQTLTINAP